MSRETLYANDKKIERHMPKPIPTPGNIQVEQTMSTRIQDCTANLYEVEEMLQATLTLVDGFDDPPSAYCHHADCLQDGINNIEDGLRRVKELVMTLHEKLR